MLYASLCSEYNSALTAITKHTYAHTHARTHSYTRAHSGTSTASIRVSWIMTHRQSPKVQGILKNDEYQAVSPSTLLGMTQPMSPKATPKCEWLFCFWFVFWVFVSLVVILHEKERKRERWWGDDVCLVISVLLLFPFQKCMMHCVQSVSCRFLRNTALPQTRLHFLLCRATHSGPTCTPPSHRGEGN